MTGQGGDLLAKEPGLARHRRHLSAKRGLSVQADAFGAQQPEPESGPIALARSALAVLFGAVGIWLWRRRLARRAGRQPT